MCIIRHQKFFFFSNNQRVITNKIYYGLSDVGQETPQLIALLLPQDNFISRIKRIK